MNASRPSYGCFPVVVVGTRAQLIKVAPILRELEARSIDYRLVFTGQHLETMAELLHDFGVKTEPIWLGRPREIDSVGAMIPWILGALWRLTVSSRRLLRAPSGSRPVVVVHGDTASTLLGALAGRLNGKVVAHIESGLRSFNWRDPFPEELTRLLVFRLASTGFCPGEWATANLGPYRIKAINTQSNTLLDAVRFATRGAGDSAGTKASDPYCVVSIHRFENLRSARRLSWILEKVSSMAKEYRVEFVMHPATRSRLRNQNYMDALRRNPSIALRDRMGYLAFLRLIADAEFVLTDGGSNQEELSYLRKPTLIARERSERKEGLGESAELISCDGSQDWRAILDLIQGRLGATESQLPDHQPSRIIVDSLPGLLAR